MIQHLPVVIPVHVLVFEALVWVLGDIWPLPFHGELLKQGWIFILNLSNLFLGSSLNLLVGFELDNKSFKLSSWVTLRGLSLSLQEILHVSLEIVNAFIARHLLKVSWTLLECVGLAWEFGESRAQFVWARVPEVFVKHLQSEYEIALDANPCPAVISNQLINSK